MIVYKVVRRRNNRLYSALHHPSTNGKFAARRRSGVILEYSDKEYTRPKFGKILAFRSSADARNFNRANGSSSSEVWKAEAPDAIPVHTLHSDADLYLHLIKNIWLPKPPLKVRKMDAPVGTVGCSSLLLLKRVE